MIIKEIQKLSPSNLLEFYELDLSYCRGKFGETSTDKFYWCDGVNELGNSVIWKTIEYVRYPISATGFDKDGSGSAVRPKLAVSNINYIIGSQARTLNDLLGARLKRTRTFARYIDASNFGDGNPNADPNAYLDEEIWILDRKVSEDATVIEWELTAPFDIVGVTIPRRICTQNTCVWKYRGPECGYTGTTYFKLDDTPTLNPAEDSCGKRISSCKARFRTSTTQTVDTSKNTTLNVGTIPDKPVFVNGFDPFYNSYAVWGTSSSTPVSVTFNVYLMAGDYTFVLTGNSSATLRVSGTVVGTNGSGGYIEGSFNVPTSGMKLVQINASNSTMEVTPGVAVGIYNAIGENVFNLKRPYANNVIASGEGSSILPFGGFPGIGLTY